MNFTQYLLILGARKWLVFWTFVVCVLTTTIITFLLPKQYTAAASIVVNVKSKDPLTGQVLPVQLLPGYLTTQVDIIKSEHVALRVVHELKLASDPTTQALYMKATKGRGDIRDWLATLLLKHLSVKPLPRANVVKVAFTATEPHFAALTANAFVKAYIATNLDLQKAPEEQTAAWLDQQVQRLRTRLSKAQQKLAKYQLTHGIVGTGQGGTVQSLRVFLIQSEAKLAQLGQTLGKNNPKYRRAQAEVGLLKSRLNAAARLTAAGNSGKNGATGSSQNGMLLQRNVQNYKLMYNNAMQRYEAATMEAAYNETDVAPLNTAIPPTEASWPKPLVNIPIAVVLGLMLGVAFALFAEMADRRVRSGQDIVTDVLIPVLAELSPKTIRFAWLRRRMQGPRRTPA
ncbi:MAG: Wzz/FepE/Etk N-terminal domain-containing protein [Acidiferrobacteraceae bacterium]